MPYAYKREPAARKRISEIMPEECERVQILGRIRETGPNSFVLEDETASMSVAGTHDAAAGDMVRVFAKVVPSAEGFALRAEIVQDMNGLDADLYKRVVLDKMGIR